MAEPWLDHCMTNTTPAARAATRFYASLVAQGVPAAEARERTTAARLATARRLAARKAA